MDSRANTAILERPTGTPSSSNPVEFSWLERFARWVLWVLCLPVLLIVALEALFFMAHVGEEEFARIDPILGLRHMPNKLVTYRSEGFSQDNTNSRGFRDVEYAAVKPAGVTRIAVLGDSQTEAIQVPLKASYSKLLEGKLNSTGLGKFEVLNFGMSSFSTGQEYLRFLKDVVPFKPDIVIVAYDLHDAQENAPPATLDEALPRPYFVVDGSGRLKIDWSLMDAWLSGQRAKYYILCDWLRYNSRILGVLDKNELMLQTDKNGKAVLKALSSPFSWLWSRLPAPSIPSSDPTTVSLRQSLQAQQTAVNLPRDLSQEQLPFSNEYRVTLAAHNEHAYLTSAIFRQFHNACRTNGCRLIVAALPASNIWSFYFREIKQLQSLAAKEGFLLIDTNSRLTPLPPAEFSRYFYNLHLNKSGHQIIAGILFEELMPVLKSERLSDKGNEHGSPAGRPYGNIIRKPPGN